MCVVPRVTGATLAQAKRAIATARCSVGTVARASSNIVRRGRVLAQKPKAGVKRAVGAKIDLVVSKGKNRQ
jgi:serine/threonine-protein kinase